ncbi:hypothetical protein MPLB_1490033 [Mesorhizobium sp. ORS 3324]|nr:hypothetical protein MPLB_1490033 [Mesorhizobium sp. ORS 3324]
MDPFGEAAIGAEVHDAPQAHRQMNGNVVLVYVEQVLVPTLSPDDVAASRPRRRPLQGSVPGFYSVATNDPPYRRVLRTGNARLSAPRPSPAHHRFAPQWLWKGAFNNGERHLLSTLRRQTVSYGCSFGPPRIAESPTTSALPARAEWTIS